MKDRSRDPEKEKQRDYDSQRISDAEYPHAERRNRPRRRARLHRAHRREESQILAGMMQEPDAETPFPTGRRGDSRLYTDSTPLGESVERRLLKRVRRTGYNLTKRPYRPEDREAFERMLQSIVAGRSAALAEEMYRRLDSPSPWMEAFVADSPEWAARLRAWTEDVLGC